MYKFPSVYFVCIDGRNIEWFSTLYEDMSYKNYIQLQIWPDTHHLTVL